ncbi:MerR family transcriptional regulator [Tepidamorphus sp. 3E244]|uniref:MerR family transcriptional regulator n=1 Tax=Tepidamorphus sp. 3E244 TaxID=3385498 RepID=UPI0038FCB557
MDKFPSADVPLNTAAAEMASGAPEAQSYSIAELSEEFDLTMRTLRFYEEKNLLNPVRRGNRRIYRQHDHDRLSDIVRLKAMGLTISEIQTIVESIVANKPDQARKLALAAAERRCEEIDDELAALKEAQQAAGETASALRDGKSWFHSA